MSVRWDPREPSLIQTLVLYADVLGFRDLTERAFRDGRGADFLRQIKCSLDAAYDIVREKAKFSTEELSSAFEIKVFTDNIVVAPPPLVPEHDSGEPELIDILSLFMVVQANLAADGFFLRGAIAYGDHYQDDTIVYGNALIEAYKLDRSRKPPRLVIAPSVEQLIIEHLSWYGAWSPHRNLLLEDPCDNRLFVDYLGAAYWNFPDFPIDHNLLAAHSSEVGRNLDEHACNAQIRKKYEWLAVYHNYVCRTLAARYQYSGDEEADPETWAARADAQLALKHLVPLEPSSSLQPPRPLDAQRLRERNP